MTKLKLKTKIRTKKVNRMTKLTNKLILKSNRTSNNSKVLNIKTKISRTSKRTKK
jgi:hypothetical protein